MSDYIQPVDISTAAFIGYLPSSQITAGTLQRLSSWSDFVQLARLSPNSGQAWTDLAYAVRGFFENGGRKCVLAAFGSGGQGELPLILEILAGVDDIAMVVAPGQVSPTTYAALVDHCETRRDRLAILDGPARATDEHLKVLAGVTSESPDGWQMPPPAPGGFATLYTPWLRVADPEAPDGQPVLVPPSGHLAGVWAGNDARRGVWKSPAGVPISGALDLSRAFTTSEGDLLNPRGVNLLRGFPGRGIQVWGARTLSENPEWRYIATRRLVMMITRSIGQATSWALNERNDEPLWSRLQTDIGSFLFDLWRAGALVGDKPEHAFFVRCDRTTMTQNDIDAGRVILMLGLATMRPAEFTVVRLQWSAIGFEVL